MKPKKTNTLFMRIIGGTYKRRQLETPQDRSIRPTTDRVRETLFNMLDSLSDFQWQGAHVLDAFAGTGALGLEALSRGASHCTFWDNDREACQLVRKNCQIIEDQSRYIVLNQNALQPKNHMGLSFDMVFCDPPYGQGLAEQCLRALQDKALVHEKTVFVLEDEQSVSPVLLNTSSILKSRQCGKTTLTVLRMKS
jgi:16S rRNA (guanine966-N2)-methyltransferase